MFQISLGLGIHALQCGIDFCGGVAQLLERCVGQYYCDDMEGKYNMVRQDGKLWIEHLRFGLRELYWVGNDTFFYDKFKQ